MKIVLVTGGFDPLHSGHIEYFKSAKQLGDKLIVGINSDSWLENKKGRAFMPCHERVTIIENLKMVDGVILFDDSDGTAIEAIKNVQQLYPNDQIIFANGGDRTADNIPEAIMSDVIFRFGVGGESKLNSSSWILDEWKAPKTIRPWGYYRILHDVSGTKVKELTIEPKQSLSLQRHKFRQEFWHVTSGKCHVEQRMPTGYTLPTLELTKFSQVIIPINDWHKLINPFDEPCKIVEIQYGEKCEETDIERLD
jgi:cytidyltransferase-like protein